MSRGGGGRGGRGGRRGGGPQLPWENEEIDARPSELFPPYNPPSAKPLTHNERRAVESFLLLRRQIHDGPLYTSRKLPGPTTTVSPSSASYRGKRSAAAPSVFDPLRSSRATVDPFTAVPTYSQRFVRPERTLPDFSSRPFCPEFVPQELHATLEGRDSERGVISAASFKGRKTKRLHLSRITALPTAEDVFGVNGGAAGVDGEWGDDDGDAAAGVVDPTARTKMTLEALQRLEDEPAAGEGDEVDDEDENAAEEEEQDLEYDDEDAGDYDAENYFDGGDEYDDDMGGDDDPGDAF